MTNTHDCKPKTVTDSIEAARFAGAVYDDANADIGTNAAGERVVRIDLTYGRGPAAVGYTLIVALDAAIALRNHLDAAFAAAGVEDEPGADVDPEDACPHCGERKQDQLVWVADGAAVRCHNCGHVFQPRFR